ncbi:MAG TPA: hypothetical protein VF905_08530, partial [Nitrospirota bacterium]
MDFFKKVLQLAMLVIVLMASFISFSYAVEKNKEPEKKIDLAMTLKFIQSWSKRDKWDKFPESPSF